VAQEIGGTVGIVVARPVIKIDGEAQPDLDQELLSLLVEETTDGLYRCEARFGNWRPTGTSASFSYFDRETLDFGKPIVIRSGVGEGEGEIFNGRISAIEAHFTPDGPPSLSVLAEDRLMDLRMTRRTRFWEDMTDSDIIGQIASDHGLTPDIGITGAQHSYIAQLNQSDLAFVRERARRADAEVWVTDRTLSVKKRSDRAGSASDVPTIRLDVGLLEFTVLADLAHQRTKVTVTGWDVAAKRQISADGDDSALSSELRGGDSGASILSEAFGDRVENFAHQQPMNDSEAQALAEAAFRAIGRQFITGAGTARGDSRLRVGALVELPGLGPLFEGRYVLTEVRHVFGPDSGFLTEFRVERAALGRP
jgi:phage protein D